MSAQPDLFRKPAPRGASRSPGLRIAVWALFSEGLQLHAPAVAKLLGANLDLVYRRIDDLRRDGYLEPAGRSPGRRRVTIWRMT